jgi:hypothetical protein
MSKVIEVCFLYRKELYSFIIFFRKGLQMKEGVIRFVEQSENCISPRTTTRKSVPVATPQSVSPVWIIKLEKFSGTNPT